MPKSVRFGVCLAFRAMRFQALAACAAVLSLSAFGYGQNCTLDGARGTRIEAQPFLKNALGAQWNRATDRIAFARPDASNVWHIFTSLPDHREQRALASVSSGQQGAPYWHPSGRYILFVAQKSDWTGKTLFGVPNYEALPGFGRHDDMWLAAIDGSGAWQLTHDANASQQGILLPVFSPDGKRVAWSARQSDGKYTLQVASFVDRPSPHLADIRSYQPGGAAYYEPGSFTSDSRSLIYTSDQDTHSFWRSQIYSLDLASGSAERLTKGGNYNEHPVVVQTPSGDWVIYMSTEGVDRYPLHLLLGADWYAMRIDGSGTKRLSEMNVRRAGNSENTGRMLVAGTVAMSPSGTFFLGDVQNSLLRQTGEIKVVHFTCP